MEKFFCGDVYDGDGVSAPFLFFSLFLLFVVESRSFRWNLKFQAWLQVLGHCC